MAGWNFEPAYAGGGVARFATNPGTISGPTTVRYAEDGSLLEFRMTADHLEAETRSRDRTRCLCS